MHVHRPLLRPSEWRSTAIADDDARLVREASLQSLRIERQHMGRLVICIPALPSMVLGTAEHLLLSHPRAVFGGQAQKEGWGLKQWPAIS